MSKNPTVFISYSFDSIDHANRVLLFSNQLRSEGIDCILDQYEESPPEGWPRWMDKKIRDSDFVLMVCTEPYCQKIMGDHRPGLGLGVQWEGGLIYQNIYDTGSNNKFIPILFANGDSAYIPPPLKGATRYWVDNLADYDKLYWRLRGQPVTEKPPLGKLRPLPTKQRKTDVGMFLTGFIDVDLWNKAGWQGLFFMSNKNQLEPPWLGLLFSNSSIAEEIFKGWRKRLGDHDKYEELRLSIVEGDIEGKPPGYSVHIGANPDNILRRAKENGIDLSTDYIAIISRIHRMTPKPGSRNLAMFKEQYQKFNTYFLAPTKIEQDKISFSRDLVIVKRELNFRTVDEIEKDDLDSVVLMEKFGKAL